MFRDYDYCNAIKDQTVRLTRQFPLSIEYVLRCLLVCFRVFNYFIPSKWSNHVILNDVEIKNYFSLMVRLKIFLFTQLHVLNPNPVFPHNKNVKVFTVKLHRNKSSATKQVTNVGQRSMQNSKTRWHLSYVFQLLYGVPQGSVLGPLYLHLIHHFSQYCHEIQQ